MPKKKKKSKQCKKLNWAEILTHTFSFLYVHAFTLHACLLEKPDVAFLINSFGKAGTEEMQKSKDHA